MFSLDDIRERRGEFSDEAKQRAELGHLPEQKVELDNVAEQRAKINDLLVQGTDLGDLSEQTVESDDLQEQRVELDDLPEQGVELDDLPEQRAQHAYLEEQGAELGILAEQRAELDHRPEKRAKVDYLPEPGDQLGDQSELRVGLDDLSEQGVEVDDLTEQGDKLGDQSELRVELDDLSEQGDKLGDQSELRVELDDLLEQAVEVDDLTEQGAEHAYLEEESAELDHPPEKRAKVDYLPEQGDQLGDQSELSVELDDLSEQGPAAFDDLLEGRAALYNLGELDDPDDLEQQGALLQDLPVEEKSVDEVFELTTESTVHSVVFSVNGDTLYVVMGATIQRINLMTWDISSKKYKGERNWGFLSNVSLFPVKRGVLFQRNSFSLELWSSELSECIQSWTDFYFSKVARISEELVALITCNSRKSEVMILDTTSGDTVSIIGIFDGVYLACNSKCEVLTMTHRFSLQLRRDDIVLWDNYLLFDLPFFDMRVVFSPTERSFVISGGPTLYVFDTVSGRALHMFCSLKYTLFDRYPRCEFVSDDQCVVSFHDKSRGACLQLYNAKSGELLSEIVEESEVLCLAASPIKRLVAIGFKGSKNKFEIIQVKLPVDKERRNNKRFELQESDSSRRKIS